MKVNHVYVKPRAGWAPQGFVWERVPEKERTVKALPGSGSSRFCFEQGFGQLPLMSSWLTITTASGFLSPWLCPQDESISRAPSSEAPSPDSCNIQSLRYPYSPLLLITLLDSPSTPAHFYPLNILATRPAHTSALAPTIYELHHGHEHKAFGRDSRIRCSLWDLFQGTWWPCNFERPHLKVGLLAEPPQAGCLLSQASEQLCKHFSF